MPARIEVGRLSVIIVPILAALSVATLLLWLRRRRLEQQRAELERQRRQLDTVKRSADSLLAILADILDYTRLDAEDVPLKPGPCDPLQVVREVMTLFAPQAEKKGSNSFF